jgi:protein-tyrosine phosphatase
MTPTFVDIHCHLLPGVDDGAEDLAAALAMARMAVADGIRTIVATPHQLGSFAHNGGGEVRRRVAELQHELTRAGIPLTVLPGGDVRIEDDLARRIAVGDVLTLADCGRHVLLELPHELYLPLEGTLDSLRSHGVVGILSHPERNAGLLSRPDIVEHLVDEAGCLMQVTAGSVTGAFGPHSQRMAEWMLAEGLVHFIASDAHGVVARRPRLRRAYDRVAELAGAEAAIDLCCRWPAQVAAGADVPTGRRSAPVKARSWGRLLSRTKAGR